MTSETCPCCGNTLLRHAKSNRLYWFCNSCYQEMYQISEGCILSQVKSSTNNLTAAAKSFKK